MALFSESPRALQLAERCEIVLCTMQQCWVLGCGALAGGGTWLPRLVPDRSSSAAAAGLGCAALCEYIFVGTKVSSGFCRAAITRVSDPSCCL